MRLARREERDTKKTTRSSLGCVRAAQARARRSWWARPGVRACIPRLPGAPLGAREEKRVPSPRTRIGRVCVVYDVDARCCSSSHTRERRNGEGGSRRSRCDMRQPESREDRPSRVHPRLAQISSLPLSLVKVLPSSKVAPVSSCDGLVLLAGQGGMVVEQGLASLCRLMYSCEHLTHSPSLCLSRNTSGFHVPRQTTPRGSKKSRV